MKIWKKFPKLYLSEIRIALNTPSLIKVGPKVPGGVFSMNFTVSIYLIVLVDRLRVVSVGRLGFGVPY